MNVPTCFHADDCALLSTASFQALLSSLHPTRSLSQLTSVSGALLPLGLWLCLANRRP